MFGSCESSDSDYSHRSNIDSFFPSILSRSEKLMVSSDPEHKRVKDFETYYINKERINFFQQHVSFSFLGDEEKVILEACSTIERANMTTLDYLSDLYFYLYLPIIRNIGDLVPFSPFERRSISDLTQWLELDSGVWNHMSAFRGSSYSKNFFLLLWHQDMN